MKTSSLSELKKELQVLDSRQLVELCIGLAKYKKENKELLHYLLFESHNLAGFVTEIKAETDEYFSEINSRANLYLVKKSLRKILRSITKYNKYTGDKASAAELLLYFCLKIKQSGIPVHKSTALENLVKQQIKKIHTLIATLHEDLQSDYLRELEELKL